MCKILMPTWSFRPVFHQCSVFWLFNMYSVLFFGGRERGGIVGQENHELRHKSQVYKMLDSPFVDHSLVTDPFVFYCGFLSKNKKLLQESGPSPHPQEKNTQKKKKNPFAIGNHPFALFLLFFACNSYFVLLCWKSPLLCFG